MNLALQFRDQLVGPLGVVGDELDQLISALNTRLQFGADGSFKLSAGGETGEQFISFKVSDGTDVTSAVVNGVTVNTLVPKGQLITLAGNTTDRSSSTGATTSVGVTGPASAASNSIAVFNGTTGKIIKDGGSTIAGLSGVLAGTLNGATGMASWNQTRVVLTDGQMKSLNSTPITVIAAPATGYIAIPIMCWCHTYIPVTGYNTSNSCSLRYNGIAVDIGNAMALASTIAEDSYKYISIQGANFNSANTNPAATAVEIRATGNLTGGASANTFTVLTTYVLINATGAGF